MSDYIKRSDALNFDLEIECEPDALQPMMEGMARVMDYIKKLPAADVVEVRHGAWVWDDARYDCSECGHHAYGNSLEIISGKYHYCPNCGAKMDGGAER